MSGDRPWGRDLVPSSPLGGLRTWFLSSPMRLRLLIVVVVLVGTVGVAVGSLVLLGTEPFAEPTDAEAGPTTPTPPPTATPTATPTPTATATTTPRDLVAGYRTATVVGTTTGGYVSLQFPGGEVRQLPLAGVRVPAAGGASPATFDGVVAGEAGRACLGTYGSRVAVAMGSWLAGERVGARVVSDPTVPGDVGVYVRNGGRVVNRELVRRGYARATTSEYRDVMVDARETGSGLWECGTVEPTAGESDVAVTVEVNPEPAADEGGLRVVEVRPNPPDGAPLSAETVTLRNAGSTTVDLEEWTVGDESGTRRTLLGLATREDRRLQPGEQLVVHTGSGQPRDGHLYLDGSHQLWDDAGDVVRLTGPSYRRTVTVRYGSAAPAEDDARQVIDRRPFSTR